MLTRKSFVIDTEIMENVKNAEWVMIDSTPFSVLSNSMRCNAVHNMTKGPDVYRALTSNELETTMDYARLVRVLCDALNIDIDDIDCSTVAVSYVRNRVPKKDTYLRTDGHFAQDRTNKKGRIRMTYVGARLNRNGDIDPNGDIDVPCTANGVLRPFKSMGIVDVWHSLRDEITRVMADRYGADSRHVRVTLRYTGSVDVRG